MESRLTTLLALLVILSACALLAFSRWQPEHPVSKPPTHKDEALWISDSFHDLYDSVERLNITPESPVYDAGIAEAQEKLLDAFREFERTRLFTDQDVPESEDVKALVTEMTLLRWNNEALMEELNTAPMDTRLSAFDDTDTGAPSVFNSTALGARYFQETPDTEPLDAQLSNVGRLVDEMFASGTCEDPERIQLLRDMLDRCVETAERESAAKREAMEGPRIAVFRNTVYDGHDGVQFGSGNIIYPKSKIEISDNEIGVLRGDFGSNNIM